MTVKGDNPIRESADDTLGRSRVAKSFAEQVLLLDASEGLVVGVLGAWGHGKTSFVNLSRGHLAASGLVVLDFNPCACGPDRGAARARSVGSALDSCPGSFRRRRQRRQSRGRRRVGA
ncbi:MAG: KAP family NTPase [Actinobacteria bacterium]|nr:KAP family NTPase [Actinomycetota bacterium]